MLILLQKVKILSMDITFASWNMPGKMKMLYKSTVLSVFS